MPESERQYECAFCGEVVGNRHALMLHVEVCPKHPMFALRQAYDKVLDKVRALEAKLKAERTKHE